jgi:Fe2+ transport system protein FeoA
MLHDAVIEGVEGDPVQRRRLLEAGFTPGSTVRFVMATPFGDPLVFSLRGASIALRKTEARCVRVRY